MFYQLSPRTKAEHVVVSRGYGDAIHRTWVERPVRWTAFYSTHAHRPAQDRLADAIWPQGEKPDMSARMPTRLAWRRAPRRVPAPSSPGPRTTATRISPIYVAHHRQAIWVCDTNVESARRGENCQKVYRFFVPSQARLYVLRDESRNCRLKTIRSRRAVTAVGAWVRKVDSGNRYFPYGVSSERSRSS